MSIFTPSPLNHAAFQSGTQRERMTPEQRAFLDHLDMALTAMERGDQVSARAHIEAALEIEKAQSNA